MKQSLTTMWMVAVVVLLWQCNLTAQMPRTIGYQGVLSDGSGNFVADGTYSLTLRIYDNVAAPTAIYSETLLLPVIKGVFNAAIGSVVPIPTSLAFDRAYFLGVSINGGSELTPRTTLSAVPYAFRAGIADQLAPGVSGVVTNVNGSSGALTIVGTGTTTVSTTGTTVTINSTGTGGTAGVQNLQNTDGSLTIANATGPTTTVNIASSGVTSTMIATSAITSSHVLDGSIAGLDILDASVTSLDVSSGAALSGHVLSANGTGGVAWAAPTSGLVLPYSGTANATNTFAVANSSTAADVTAVMGTISSTNSSSYSAGIKGVNNSATLSGIGVWGAHISDGSGVFGNAPSGTGVYGSSTSGIGVKGSSTTGNAASFFITNSASSSEALKVTTLGTSYAGFFIVSNSSSSADGLYATSNSLGSAIRGSQTRTTGIARGVSGYISSAADNSAAVYGQSGSSSGASTMGVYGENFGAGIGVQGRSTSGIGVIGIGNSTGVRAEYTGSTNGAALELNNGYIRVSGTNRTAFTHTVPAANAVYFTNISYPGMAATDILSVTPVWTSTYYTAAWAIYWNGSAWSIFSQNQSTVVPGGMKFNIVVIKQ